MSAYLAEAKKELTAEGGFPLVSGLGRVATADTFKNAGKTLKYITADLASPTFQKYALRDRSNWKPFIASVESQQGVAKALLGDQAIIGTAAIVLEKVTDATRSKDEWRGTWRDMKLLFDGSGGEVVRTESEADQKLGDAPVSQKLELKMIKNVNEASSPTFSIETSEWGPLWLIHKYKGERDKSDPKTWLVEFPAGAPGAVGKIRLRIKFASESP